MRIRVFVAATLVSLSLTTAAFGDEAGSKTYQIGAQPVSSALKAFAAQSSMQLIFTEADVGSAQTSGLNATLVPRDALAEILRSTDLEFEFTANNVIVIRKAGVASEARTTGLRPVDDRAAFRLVQSDSSEVKDPNKGDASKEEPPKKIEELEEVIVTAQRRSQSIKDVPISITAISGEELKAAGIKNAQDLSFKVPGLVVAEVNPGYQMIAIRGIGSERGGSALTGIYLDEIPLSSSVSGNQAGIDLRMKDLQRVEVLKGPQGTLFGEGSAGGTLRFMTNSPRLDRVEGSVTGSFYDTQGGDLSYEVDGVLNLPVIDNVFGVRIVASHEDRRGWIDAVSTTGGPVIDDNINSNETNEVRVKALWKPTDKLSVEGLVLAYRMDGSGHNIVNLEPRRDHLQRVPGTGNPADGQGSIENEYKIYNLSMTYDLGFAELLSSTSKADLDSLMDQQPQFFPGNQAAANLLGIVGIVRTLAPGETVPVEIVGGGTAPSVSSFSQELRLTSAHDGPVNWVLGAYYKDVESLTERPEGTDIIVADIIVYDERGRGTRATSTSKAWATYGDASVKLPHGWEIGGGLRYFSEDRTGYNPDAKAASFASGVSEKTTYRAYVSYSLTDTVRLYANTSTGFRSGGFNAPFYVNLGAPATFEPETVEAYELGAKSSFLNGRVSADIAVFKNEYVDIQGDTTRSGNNGQLLQFTANAGEAEIKGIEASLGLRLMDRWQLFLSGELLESEFKKVDEFRPGETIAGDPVNFVPDYKWVVSSEYDFDWTAAGLSSRFRLSYSEQGPSHYTFRNNISARVFGYAPAMEFLDAGLETSWQSWTVTLFGRNLLNEDGTLRANSTGIDPQPRPRSIGITLEKKF